ncbi:hypothetical protein K3172_03225 [Qipengyuania sp. 6B39]|uniref:hypothetical protein n=1 Tax=Qipengyuania proteolytica TaxID=2867239 RepID=UPI001C8A5CB8|nr:hypothetical protein [Qipengyuania proteolytica]MBX7494867.1 hypothetical protein [Qipengyuania proteolytica]
MANLDRKSMIVTALRKEVLPKFVERGFEKHDWWELVSADRAFLSNAPFGQLRRPSESGTQLVEILIEKWGDGFGISAGTVDPAGIVGPEGRIPADQVLSTWLDEWVSAYAWPRYFVPFRPDRFWRRVRTQEDVDRYVAGCAGVVDEIVAFLDHGIVGRRLRHSVIDRGYGPVRVAEAR